MITSHMGKLTHIDRTPIHVLQELGAWKTGDMVKRYAHLSSEHLTKFAVNMHEKLH